MISFHWNMTSEPGDPQLPPTGAGIGPFDEDLLGTTKLFRDLDILWPSSPRTMPLTRMQSQGLTTSALARSMV